MGRPSSGADHLVVADFRIHIRLDQREEELQVAGMSVVVQEVADQAGEGVFLFMNGMEIIAAFRALQAGGAMMKRPGLKWHKDFIHSKGQQDGN